MWFKSVAENIEDGLKMLRTDKDAMELAQIGPGFCRNSCTIEEIEVEEVAGPCKDGVGTTGLVVGPIGKAQQMSLAKGKQEAQKAKAPIVGKHDRHQGSDTKLEGGSDDDSQDEDFEPISDGSDTDLPWSDTESEDSAHDIVFDDSDDDGNVDGGLFDIKVKSMDEEENIFPEQGGQATPTSNKGKEVVMAGFRDEDDGYDSEELPDLPSSDAEGDVQLKKYPLHKDLKDMSKYKWEVGTLLYQETNSKIV
ncbi:hypothetical protein PIB30_079515 [Stylosanthes scabra]|uniref:Uncharacterized protein n=1 Tax=Stylosanthes scabra TaxID=79078 RepID=A0ABU6YQ51_9FABA|nr:hypothetical protein [Stylosanthes scabra]